jgi:plastocyanin
MTIPFETRFVFRPLTLLILGTALGLPHMAEGDPTGIIRGQILINSKPASGAVVYLKSPDNRTLASEPVEKTIRQENIRFHPDFLIIPAGSTVDFENLDDEIHNIHSVSSENRFDTGAHLPGRVKKITLKNPGAVSIRCRTHPTMRGTIFVTPSSYFSSTDASGRFEIRDVPQGPYRIEAWHPRLSSEERMEGGKTVDLKTLEVVVLRFTAGAAAGADLTDSAGRDWHSIVEEIRHELERAIALWKKEKSTAATLTVMKAHSKLYGESGLRERIAQALGAARATEHERRFDLLRKHVQGISATEPDSEAALRREAAALVDGLTADGRKMTVP